MRQIHSQTVVSRFLRSPRWGNAGVRLNALPLDSEVIESAITLSPDPSPIEGEGRPRLSGGDDRRPKRHARGTGWILSLCAILTLFTGCADVTVGSKTFPESWLLAEMMAALIEQRTDLSVDRRIGLGGTLICFSALEYDEIDLYAEYTGTGLEVILKERLVEKDPDVVYARVKDEFAQRYDIEWLAPFGFNNSYVLAVRPEIDAETISDLRNHRTTLRAGFNHEFLNREDGYAGLSKHYGFSLDNVKGLEHGLAYVSIADDRIDVIDAYSTDGKLLKYQLKLLKDDQQFFPPYFAAPIVRSETLAKFPQLREALEPLAGLLTDETITALNYQVEVERRDPVRVAREFLIAQGLLPASLAAGPSTGETIARRTGEHLLLTVAATAAAACCGILLGIWIAHRPVWAGGVLGAAGVVQTVPSLALLAFLIPLLGIGVKPALAAMFLYGLLPILRNTCTGIASVPSDLKEAGRGMGMTERQIMWQLEMPLATKTIMAGVRTSLVINIGTATLAAFIGAGGLGQLIVAGLNLNDTSLILQGAIPAAVLAVVADFGMSRLERMLEPKGLRVARQQEG